MPFWGSAVRLQNASRSHPTFPSLSPLVLLDFPGPNFNAFSSDPFSFAPNASDFAPSQPDLGLGIPPSFLAQPSFKRKNPFPRTGLQPWAACWHVHSAGVIISTHWLAVHPRSFQRSKQGRWEISIQLAFWTLNHKHLHFYIQRPHTQSVQKPRE